MASKTVVTVLRAMGGWILPVALSAAVIVVAAGAGTARAAGGMPAPRPNKLMDKNIEDAVNQGLEYLANTQRPDGQWFPSGGYGTYPTVMTSLAGMALIAGGNTPESGKYAKNVRKAMYYILRTAESQQDGFISNSSADGRSMYGHGFAMLFLSQCYGMDLDPATEKRICKVLTDAVKVTAKCQSDLGKQNDHVGGWIYQPDGSGDEGSVTVTQLQALRGCRNAGIKVPKSTIDRAVGYLKYSQNGDGGISYSAQSKGSSRPAISAAAIACFFAAGVYDRQAGAKEGVEAQMVDKLIKYCARTVNTEGNGEFGGYYFYTHLYYAEAMYQRGGADWAAYYPKICQRLLSMKGADGSWNGDGIGNTYGTAIACIIMQLPNGYLPICQR